MQRGLAHVFAMASTNNHERVNLAVQLRCCIFDHAASVERINVPVDKTNSGTRWVVVAVHCGIKVGCCVRNALLNAKRSFARLLKKVARCKLGRKDASLFRLARLVVACVYDESSECAYVSIKWQR